MAEPDWSDVSEDERKTDSVNNKDVVTLASLAPAPLPLAQSQYHSRYAALV